MVFNKEAHSDNIYQAGDELASISDQDILKVKEETLKDTSFNLIDALYQCSKLGSLKHVMPDDLYSDMIGYEEKVDTLIGRNTIIYADWTASGKPLHMIEDTIRQTILPFYGSCQSISSANGKRVSDYRKQAKQIILDNVNASPSEDVLVFTGNGCTGAIHTLIQAMQLKEIQKHFLMKQRRRPVVFVSSYEHNSNLLPWREADVDVVRIVSSKTGTICEINLAKQLKRYATRPLIIGSFSACSNITGLIPDIEKITSILHQHGALSFWDYATYAPHCKIDMNPSTYGSLACKDAIFISVHKFLGGPSTPGILVAKKKLFQDLKAIVQEDNDESVASAIACIRAGLTFYVHSLIDDGTKTMLEERNAELALCSFTSNKNIAVMGGYYRSTRLPIFSVLIRWGKKFLHSAFVCTLLNDLYGIQSRGGCLCAGPYALRLLGIKASKIHLERLKCDEAIRPGVTRISFPYFMSIDHVQYVIQAIHSIANWGYMMLHCYSFDLHTGMWRKGKPYKPHIIEEEKFRMEDELNWFVLPSEVSKLSFDETRYYHPPAQCDIINTERGSQLR